MQPDDRRRGRIRQRRLQKAQLLAGQRQGGGGQSAVLQEIAPGNRRRHPRLHLRVLSRFRLAVMCLNIYPKDLSLKCNY